MLASLEKDLMIFLNRSSIEGKFHLPKKPSPPKPQTLHYVVSVSPSKVSLTTHAA